MHLAIILLYISSCVVVYVRHLAEQFNFACKTQARISLEEQISGNTSRDLSQI